MFNVFPYKHTHLHTGLLYRYLLTSDSFFINRVRSLFYCTLITSFHLHFIYYCYYYFLFECKEHRFEYIFTTTTKERESHTSIAEDKTLVREKSENFMCVCTSEVVFVSCFHCFGQYRGYTAISCWLLSLLINVEEKCFYGNFNIF